MAKTELATASFKRNAVAFLDRVELELAKVEDPAQAKHLLDQASAMQYYARKVADGVKYERPIAIAVLKMKAKLGELMPAGRRGRGNKILNPIEDFSHQSIAAYRKMSAHAELLDEYISGVDDVPSQHGFLKWIDDRKRAGKDADRQAKRDEAQEQIDESPTIMEALEIGQFSTIVIDPPWDWSDESDNSQFGRGNTTYGGMGIDELHQMPVGDFAASDAHLYLWITNRSLYKGFDLVESWGFRYITCLTWCKPSFGMGNYFRGSSEQILFGVKGSLPLNRKDVGTWFQWPRQEKHSQKPDEMYKAVMEWSPGPYLDIFARNERDGWTCWGGQIESV